MISPSLKEEVTRFIFSEQLKQNLIFALNSDVKDYVITKIELVMSQPEEIKIQQGEATYDFFIIAKGECECFIKDEHRQERFVRTLSPGQHFGEIALLTGSKRTATIQTKNYSTIGMVSQENFNELLHIFPDIKKKLNDSLVQYQDKYKQWLKSQLPNIVYFNSLRTNMLETLVYKLQQESFEEGQIIFKNGDILDKVYILADGSVDTYLSLHDEDLVLDNIKVSGSIFNQYSAIMQCGINYSARATSETNMLVISIDTINKLRSDSYELNTKLKGLI